MSCLVKKSNICSPETTVSSLLASSHDSLSHSSVQYKDKLYNSASQALEAYIKDFNLSLSSPGVRTGKIEILPRAPENFKFSEDDFEAKSENVRQHTRLGSRIAYEPDIVSLTTDDLLAFPADGSHSFRISRPLAQRSNVNRRSWTASASCSHHWTSSCRDKEKENSLKNSLLPSSYHEGSRKRGTRYKFQKHHSVLPGNDQLASQETVLHKNYPRWLTSHKTELSISDISSIPESKYPIWLKNHKLLLDSSNENSTRTSQDSRELMEFQNIKRHNDVLSLKHECDIQSNCPKDSPSACFLLQGLREHKDPLIDDTEKLIQKARRALEPSAEESTSLLKKDGSPCTVDVLEAERLWDNVPIGLKSPVPVSCVEENSPPNPKARMVNNFLEDCLQNGQQESTFSGGNHHGPVEALKLMLFNLQAVQHSFHKNKSDRPNEESPKVSSEDEGFKLNDCDMIPVARSLQRALHHLSRLKGLVNDTSGREESLKT
ncbi:lung adenoma susceptibility protein 2 [Ahaetulla prasina]|uniref:lung adenoma susceptibility protein 2 n=1 Tax=Ahaetulla prasina TaxID=499056 RepID=UPI002649E4FA|nr:lung adenoma susceptibility protein 2 [Ahaetulla prasina]XP_058026727.1 lung adenoma susceptibility protein 2 [Ahaetulla prasina]XP_058026728.1 lung adenoma susceptibility protein 2 [Ahaetulla prasina]